MKRNENKMTHICRAGILLFAVGCCAAFTGRMMLQRDKPVAVRYAWADYPAGCNFITKLGSKPLRTEDWSCITDGKVLVIKS